MRSNRADLTDLFDFPLDGFQLQAIAAIDEGHSVLVAAPTGSGKTVVAEYAIEVARQAGKRSFYTAPIKALSNQKYHDLVERYGSDEVGLLTGDNTINGDAATVVMTTEVLRNMIYARSAALDDLAVVILDEVHFLQDTYRGPVWEEVIIHLPPAVRLVCLSATVSNAGELTQWISTVRGPTTAVVEDRRPVRLENLYYVGDKTNDRMHLLPVLVDARANNDALRLDSEALRAGKGRSRAGVHGRRRLFTPSRSEVVEMLDRNRMLPAIVFIFSRNQCDEAARSCLVGGVHLTTSDEQDQIREIVHARLGAIESADLDVLGYGQFVQQLEAGVAAHHAGMVPPFKEVVEACFAKGLIKVVFATETLAVGINMPARCVVIEKLSKFTGDHHAFLTPGEYTQLTGRAGRRGIDELGQAVVLWSPFVPFDQVATLAASRSFHLNSAFRPTYNMAANLVRSYTSEHAHHLLNLSFAQYQTDREVVKIEARLEQRQVYLRGLIETATSPYGDLDEYRGLLKGVESASRTATSDGDNPIELAMMKLRPGDVIYIEKGRYAGRAAVLATAYRKGGIRITVVTTGRETVHLTELDFDDPPRSLGSVDMPSEFVAGRHDLQREVVQRLQRADMTPSTRTGQTGRARADDHAGFGHPVEDDPDLDERMSAAVQRERVSREIAELRQRVRGRSQTIARQFDQVLQMLTDRGFVSGWQLTPAGEILARTFHECDLLIVECVRLGLLDDLRPAALAALVSVFVYEHRSSDPPPTPWFPSPLVRKRWQRILAVSEQLQADEHEAGLSIHRGPDPTFVAIAFAWAAGEEFAEVVEQEELSGGDFVRTTKQLIDLLRQLAIVAPERETRRSAEQAAAQLFRGVVAASSSVDVEDDGGTGDDPQG